MKGRFWRQTNNIGSLAMTFFTHKKCCIGKWTNHCVTTTALKEVNSRSLFEEQKLQADCEFKSDNEKHIWRKLKQRNCFILFVLVSFRDSRVVMLHNNYCSSDCWQFIGLLRDNGGQKSTKQSHGTSSTLFGVLRFNHSNGCSSTGVRNVFCTRCLGSWGTYVRDLYHNIPHFSANFYLDPPHHKHWASQEPQRSFEPLSSFSFHDT